ncbi:helix-turn-helix domain-containing protein [Halomarina litorea]|uniref:helix-turn-helix domain-containing protein n=1 Tax=Halomarina litorea TaxID=2961595 RepID=UPI0020C475DF|nr:helix-turn-helix domain-containing protein [Halomarina sp. BCD28]
MREQSVGPSIPRRETAMRLRLGNLMCSGFVAARMADGSSASASGADDGDAIDSLTADLFGEPALLDLDAHLELFEEVAARPRFAVLYALQQDGRLSAKELGERLCRSENGLHYHLDRLVDAGLVANRRQSVPDRDGLYSYYELTGLGADLIDAVTAFIGAEKTALEEY